MTKPLEALISEMSGLSQLRAELSNPAIGSKDHLRKIALSLIAALEQAHNHTSRQEEIMMHQNHRVSELEPIRAAAEKLVRCKGRYHSELNYRALAALFGVTTPDLPPLDGEVSQLAVKLPSRLQPGADGWDDWYMHSDPEGEYMKADDVIAAIRAAGGTVQGDE